MTAMTSDAGAGLARRWLSRALLITGGAVAATAAAWAVSTATASADPVALDEPVAAKSSQQGKSGGPLSLTGVASDVLEPAHLPVETRPLTGGVDPVDAAVRSVGEAARSGVGETEDSLRQLWEQRVAAPVDRTVDSIGKLVPATPGAQELGGDLLHILDPAEGALSALPGLPGLAGADQQVGTPVKGGPATNAHPGPATATGGEDRAAKDGKDAEAQRPAFSELAQRPDSGGTTEAATVRPGGGSAPVGNGDWPGQHPTTMPAPFGGSTGGAHIDGSLHGIAARGVPSLDDTIVGSALAGIRYSPIQPGTQPGVTPD